jgi:hypothetical protein
LRERSQVQKVLHGQNLKQFIGKHAFIALPCIAAILSNDARRLWVIRLVQKAAGEGRFLVKQSLSKRCASNSSASPKICHRGW